MMKRIIALLLALILTVGLLPTVALAADEVTATKMEPVVVEDSGDNTTFRKTISENDDGSYKVTLEAWATGKTIVEETKIPLDIVLVLDKSGSMEETFSTKSETIYRKIERSDFRYNEYYWNWSADNIGLWYKVGEKYYKVNVDRRYEASNVHFVYTYTYQDSNGQMQTIGTSTRRYRDPGYDFYRKEVVNSTTTKMDALKEAATSFATTVQRKAAEDKLEHRIAVVSYSTDASIETGKSALVEVNKGTGLETVKEAINNLEAGGGTQIDLGIKKANEIFEAKEIEEGKRARVVIAFTDGTPGLYGYWAADGWHGLNNFNTHETANAAIQAAYSSINTYKASVYTIGIFDGADNATLPNYTKDAKVEWNYDRKKWEYVDRDVAAQAVANSNRFMHLVSSNYPTAKSMEDAGKINSELGENSFYLAASSAGELSEVFDAIGNTISTVTTTLNDKATIVDKVPSNFTISANAENISLKVANCIGENNGALTFAAPEAAPEAVKAERQGNTVLVNGFNFSDKWCGKENDAYRGQKLIVSFDITHNNYGGTQPTNDGACIKDASDESFIDVDNPSIPVKITEPSITGVTRSKVYDGTGFDVLSTIAEDINALADGKKNAYVDIVVTVTSGSNTYTYTIKKGDKSGSWDKTGLTTDKDVKIESGTVSNYTYDLSITFKDATANGAADAIEKTTATYTITKRPVTLTSGSDEKKYDGTPLTKDEVIASTSNGVGFVTGEGATYNVTGSQTNVGSSDNTFTYTLNEGTKATNYEITQETGTLTVKPIDQEVVITIKGHIVTATYDGEEKTASGYTVTVPEGVDADKITVAVAEGKTVPSVSATNATTTALVQTITADMFTVTSPYKKVTINCEDGSLTISPRKVKMVSGTASKPYDGTALTNSTVTDSGFEGYDGFVNGQGATYNVTGTITDPGSEDNRFTYTLNSNTKASNYDITTAYGKLTITGSKSYTITFKTETGGTINNQTNDITYSDLTAGTDFPNVPTTKENPGYYFDGWYKDGTKVTSFPEKVTENATYTAKWKKFESATLNLTNKFWKELTSDTATLPENANSFTLNIKNDNSQTVAQAHVLNVPLEQKSSKYTGTKAFAVESGSEMTFNAAGTYIYTVAEAAGSISGMSYDDTTYTMTVEVVANEGKLTIQSATIEGGTVDTVNLLAAEGTNSITFHNEYTKPKKSINLGDLIQKDFDKKTGSEDLPTGSSYTFRVRAYERFRKPDGSYSYSDAPYLGEVVMTEFGQKNFVFNYGVITFFEHGTHEYVVEEFNDGAENVEYDSNRYLLVLNVADDLTITARNAGSLNDEVSTQSVEQTPVITFCNKYNKEKDPDKLTINFADYVQKELTATGTKTASDVNFTVNVNGKEQVIIITSAGGKEEIGTDAEEFDPKYSTTLTARFDSITGGTVETKSFTGTTVEIDHVGTYVFELSEEDGQRTGVTYDGTRYTLTIYVNFNQAKNELYVSYAEATRFYDGTFESVALIDMVNDEPVRTTNYITFHNTIDTGKDDYYPIIIPTIINKDTGMLNKTDHFAYVIGYPDGTVHPNGQITRAEVATIFFRLLRDEVRNGAFTTSNTYSDVAYGKWYNNPISTMSALGIITGYPDGTFKPNKPITRAEFAAIAARFDETQSGKSATFSDVIGHWAAKEIGIAYYNDWIKGYPDGTFKPDQNITRAEAMTLINRVLERKPESPADLLTNMNKWTDNMDTSKWYYLDVQEATNSHAYTRKTFNYELWRQMLNDPDWSRYER